MYLLLVRLLRWIQRKHLRGPSCKLMVQVSSNLGTTVELDLEEIRDDLVEIKHTPKDGDTTIIIIERCETDI